LTFAQPEPGPGVVWSDERVTKERARREDGANRWARAPRERSERQKHSEAKSYG